MQLVRGELRSDPDDVPATLERSNLVRVLKDREVAQHGLRRGSMALAAAEP